MSHMKMYNENDNEETHCKDVHENQAFHMFKLTQVFHMSKLTPNILHV